MRPLQGISVVSLALNVPGPVAAARLLELGATVVKVEPPAGDPLAHAHRGWYDLLHARQEIVRLDLHEPRDRTRLDRLLERADLLLTSSRPATLERLALGWPELHARRPRLAQVAIVGYPRPHENRPGHDLTYVATRGLVAPPELPRTLSADLGGALRAVEAALVLILTRERGEGAGYVEVALAEAADFFAAPLRHGATSHDGTLGGGLPQYGLYRAKEGWIALAALEARFQERLRGELGLDVLTHEALEQAFRGRSPEDWEAWAAARDLPIAAVR